MNQPLTKTEIIKTYVHPMDALTGGRYMDSQDITTILNNQSEQDRRDIEKIRNTRKWALKIAWFFLLLVAVVIVFSLLGKYGL